MLSVDNLRKSAREEIISRRYRRKELSQIVAENWEWGVEVGEWRLESGGWRVEVGEWRLESGG